MVFQDGLQYQAPVVFDNLIARKAIPPMVGVFVMHGRVKSGRDDARDRMNRSYEYDSFDDLYARFLLEEMLPFVEKTHGLVLTKDPNARAIAGNSSGAIAAFAAAWTRPDAFRRVFSAIGTYVGRAAATTSRCTCACPSQADPRLPAGREERSEQHTGDWFMTNQDMLSALTYAGYDVEHEGRRRHNSRHATRSSRRSSSGCGRAIRADRRQRRRRRSRTSPSSRSSARAGRRSTSRPPPGWVPGPDERRMRRRARPSRSSRPTVAAFDGASPSTRRPRRSPSPTPATSTPSTRSATRCTSCRRAASPR